MTKRAKAHPVDVMKGSHTTALRAAKVLGVDRSAVMRYLAKGSLAGHLDQERKRWRISTDSIREFIANQRRGTAMATMLDGVHALCVDGAALVATAAAQFVRANDLIARQREKGKTPSESDVSAYHTALDTLVAAAARFEEFARVKAVVSVIASRGVVQEHPEDRGAIPVRPTQEA